MVSKIFDFRKIYKIYEQKTVNPKIFVVVLLKKKCIYKIEQKLKVVIKDAREAPIA